MQYAVFVYISSAQRSYRICFSFYSKQKTVSRANTLLRGKKKSKKLNSNNKNVINQGRKCDFLWQFSFFSCIIRKKVVPLQRFLCHVICVSSQKAIEPNWVIR